MKNSHTAVSTKKGLNYGFWFGFIVNEKQGKQESLNCYRIITSVSDQKALREQPHNTHNVDFLAKQCNAAMKKYSALSNFLNMNNPIKFLLSHSHLLSTCLYS